MPMQLQYVQLITDKTIAADVSSSLFAILNNVIQTKKNTKFVAVLLISSKTGKQCRNKGSIEVYCVFIAADSIVDAISFIRLF